MKRLRQHACQRVRVFILVALSLVPIALSGHFHTATAGSTSDSCTACVVKHDSRIANLAVQPLSALVLHVSAVVVLIAAAPAHVSRPFRTGRAPPSCSLFA